MKRLLGIATLALMLAGTTLAQNLVTNGGFESGSTTNVIGTGGLIGWVPYNEADGHYNSDAANTFLDDGTNARLVGTISGPHSGNYMAAFGAWQGAPDTPPPPSGISQSIATQAGHLYQVSFWLANDDGCKLVNDLPDCTTSIDVTFGGTSLMHDSQQQAFKWTFYSFDAYATGDSTDLIFDIRQDPHYYYLDDVSVTDNAPEPASLALLGSALGLGAGFRRRFRS